jgi:hypothetical protein
MVYLSKDIRLIVKLCYALLRKYMGSCMTVGNKVQVIDMVYGKQSGLPWDFLDQISILLVHLCALTMSHNFFLLF